uniref:Uncharacterized protein n=1 Tax=Anguilla anguilla TaxID=7936 RepID=A0A0E9WDB3_ANGAN
MAFLCHTENVLAEPSKVQAVPLLNVCSIMGIFLNI